MSTEYTRGYNSGAVSMRNRTIKLLMAKDSQGLTLLQLATKIRQIPVITPKFKYGQQKIS